MADDSRLQHASCEWQQRGPCVYCADHDERLFVGSADASPESRAAIQAMFAAAYKRLASERDACITPHSDTQQSDRDSTGPRGESLARIRTTDDAQTQSRFVDFAQRSTSGQFQHGRPLTVQRGSGSTPRCRHTFTVSGCTPSLTAMSEAPTGSHSTASVCAVPPRWTSVPAGVTL